MCARLRILRCPDGVGTAPVPEAGSRSRRRHPPARRAKTDLRRPQPDRGSGVRHRPVQGAGSSEAALVRIIHRPPCR